MLIYLFIFTITLFFAYIAEANYVKNKWLCFICLFSIVIINVVFAGFRDFGVGNDTLVYIKQYFQDALSLKTFNDFFFSDDDLGFLGLAYVSTLFGRDPQNLLVITELFIISFFVIGIYYYKKALPINIFMFFVLFCLLYYMHTLNLMRQYCAMALLFYGFSLALNGKWSIYFTSQFIAFFFHSTSVIFLLVPILYFFSNLKKPFFQYVFLSLLIVSILSALYYYYSLLSMLNDSSLVSDIYANRYGEGSVYENNDSFGFKALIKCTFPLIVIFFAYKNKVASKDFLYMTLSIYLISVLIEQVKYIMVYMFRLAHYIGIMYCVYASTIFVSSKIGLVYRSLVLLFYFYLYYLTFFSENVTDLIEYSSKILRPW